MADRVSPEPEEPSRPIADDRNLGRLLAIGVEEPAAPEQRDLERAEIFWAASLDRYPRILTRLGRRPSLDLPRRVEYLRPEERGRLHGGDRGDAGKRAECWRNPVQQSAEFRFGVSTRDGDCEPEQRETVRAVAEVDPLQPLETSREEPGAGQYDDGQSDLCCDEPSPHLPARPGLAS